MRTLSKSGLAGLRLGYLLGPAAWLQELEKIRLPYNINALTQKTAGFILSHYQVLADQAQDICMNRQQLFQQLARIDGIKTWPSAANFILFRLLDQEANQVFAGLRQRGVLIKNLHGQHALLHNCLRVTVGTPEENAVFINTLQQVLGN
jgi:histidinol-phosphate aminotransferase